MRAPRALAAGRLGTNNWQRYSCEGPNGDLYFLCVSN
jgi:hypothetical protein